MNIEKIENDLEKLDVATEQPQLLFAPSLCLHNAIMAHERGLAGPPEPVLGVYINPMGKKSVSCHYINRPKNDEYSNYPILDFTWGAYGAANCKYYKVEKYNEHFFRKNDLMHFKHWATMQYGNIWEKFLALFGKYNI